MGKTVTADFGDELKSARSASARTSTEDASPPLTLAGANVCAKVAELSHDIAEPELTRPS
jgi:hypothetical protein